MHTFSRKRVGQIPPARSVTTTPTRGLGGFLRRCIATARHYDAARRLPAVLAFATGTVCAAGLLLFLYLTWTLPDVEDIGSLFAPQSSVILDRSGTELYRIHGDEDRTDVPLSSIARSLQLATIAIEDERFFTRQSCFDIRAFLRAILHNIVSGWKSQGGSTLTQQFAKQALTGSQKTLLRKMRQVMLGCALERTYGKERILELYLNRIPYGHGIHGVEQAARTYFAQSASGLTLAQASVLAAMPQRPSYFSPFGTHVRTEVTEEVARAIVEGRVRRGEDIPEGSITLGLLGRTVGSGTHVLTLGGRTDQVLRNMRALSMISEEEERTAREQLLTLEFQRARENIRAPHFVLWIQQHVQQLFSEEILEEGGLRITTTLDWELQQLAERAVGSYRDVNRDLYGAQNASLVALSPTGDILAYVGNDDYWDDAHQGKVDMVRAPRQPGSSFKPFVYAAAFLQGYGPATVLEDVRTTFGTDRPENYDGTTWGPITMRRALGASRNIPAVKTYFLAGQEAPILSLASQMGIPSLLRRRDQLTTSLEKPYEYGWPLALGAGEVPLLELTTGYLTFQRGGSTVLPISILSIEDRNGGLLYTASDDRGGVESLDPRVAYQITSILSDVGVRPNDFWKSQLSIPGVSVAAKTGTSAKCMERSAPPPGEEEGVGECLDRKPDNTWTLGYSPALTVGVWAGNASGGTLFAKADGLTTASRVWHDFMVAAHRELPSPPALPMPSTLEWVQVSLLSGLLPSPCTPPTLWQADLFLTERIPTAVDDRCEVHTIDRVTGLLASETCPASAREERAFYRPHSVLPLRWPTWEEAFQEWVTQQQRVWEWGEQQRRDGEHVPEGSGSLLPLPLPPTEACDPALTPGRLTPPTVSFVNPREGGAATFPSFTPTIVYTVGSRVREVQYTVDGRPAGSATSPPFTPTIHVRRLAAPGQRIELRATLIDEYFNEATATVHATLREDQDAPRVSLALPTDGAVLRQGDTLVVEAQAEDSGGVDRVQFFLDSTLLTTRRNPPYTAQFPLRDTAPGPHQVEVRAEDAAGNVVRDSVTITVTEE